MATGTLVPGPTSLMLAVLAAGTCGALARVTGVTLVFGDGSLLVLALVVSLRIYVGWRMPHLKRVSLLLASLSLMTLGASAVGFLSYFAPMAGFPLRDAELRAVDLALGFDWINVTEKVDRLPWLNGILTQAYATLPVQVMAVVLILSATRQDLELDRFTVTFLVTALFAIAISAIVPALGPAPTLAHPAHFDRLELGAAWVSPGVVQALRQGSVDTIDLGKLVGIVTFPSFHTVVAFIVPWALRRTPVAFWPAVALNLLMLASTFTEGGHYLVDVLAGALVAAWGIAFARFATSRIDPALLGFSSRWRFLGRGPIQQPSLQG